MNEISWEGEALFQGEGDDFVFGYEFPLVFDITEAIIAALADESKVGILLRDRTLAADIRATFRNIQFEYVDIVASATSVRAPYALAVAEATVATSSISGVDVVRLLERVLSADTNQTIYSAAVNLLLLLTGRLYSSDSVPVMVQEDLLGADTLQYALISTLLEDVSVALSTEATLVILLDETLHVDATDAVSVLAHYAQNLHEPLTGWVGFRLGEEAHTGWVMNTEGKRPIAAYDNYNFNSFCRVGDTYYAAGDDGLYRLGGATDDGAPIDASITTMMLDFGSPRQKRVNSAYVGYTASGKLLLRVRSVDSGVLKEQWYEAQTLPADAPRENMIRIGRGLRSRYWQFQLVNVDGADFEIDKLELHPIYLNRRV